MIETERNANSENGEGTAGGGIQSIGINGKVHTRSLSSIRIGPKLEHPLHTHAHPSRLTQADVSVRCGGKSASVRPADPIAFSVIC